MRRNRIGKDRLPRSTGGFTLIEVMIASAVAGVLVLALASISTIMTHMQTQANTTFSARQIENNMYVLLNNTTAWTTYDVPHNASTACIGGAPGCIQHLSVVTPPNPVSPEAASNGYISNIYDAGGNLIYTLPNPTLGTNLGNGFTYTGATCTTYPSAGCPLQFTVYWNAICSGGSPCATPAPVFNIALAPQSTLFPNNGVTYNWSNYSANWHQGSSIDSGCWVVNSGAAPTNMTETCVTDVGIGTATPAANLDVVGSINASGAISSGGNVTGTNIVMTSDRRLKENIRSIEGLSLVLRMKGHRFQWKKDHEKDFGVIAQELETVLPEAVITDEKTGYKSVKYPNLVAPLIEAVKELDKKNHHLESQNQALQKRLDDLDSRLGSLERKSH